MKRRRAHGTGHTLLLSCNFKEIYFWKKIHPNVISGFYLYSGFQTDFPVFLSLFLSLFFFFFGLAFLFLPLSRSSLYSSFLILSVRQFGSSGKDPWVSPLGSMQCLECTFQCYQILVFHCLRVIL